MTESVSDTVAYLAGRRVAEKFELESGSPMVRVTCLRSDEIVALVRELRLWKKTAGPHGVVVAVTATKDWPGLQAEDVVPRDGLNATILRNRRGVGVVLIEGDPYSDQQSWQNVLPISDGNLLPDERARRDLIEHLLGRTPPDLLVDVLEELFDAISTQRDEAGDDRDWIRLVTSVCRTLGEADIVDQSRAWDAIGDALPQARLFRDDGLDDLHRTDRRRRLRRNCTDSIRLVYAADDAWRDALQERARAVEFRDPAGDREHDQSAIRRHILGLLGTGGSIEQSGVLFRHWLQVVDSKSEKKGLGTAIREHFAEKYPDRVGEYDDLDVADDIDAGSEVAAQELLDETPKGVFGRALVELLPGRQVTALERMAHPRAPRTTTPLAEILSGVAEMVGERAAISDIDEISPAALVLGVRRDSDGAAHSRGIFAWLFGPTLRGVVDRLEGGPFALEIAPELLDLAPLEGFERDGHDTDGADDDGDFERLELRLSWSDGSGSERRIDWYPRDTPGLVALWRLACRPEAVAWRPSSTIDFDAWLESALRRSTMVGGQEASDGAPEIAVGWWETRAETLRNLRTSGLRRSLLEGYADAYSTILSELRNHFVPMGAGRREVAAVLDTDIFVADEWAVVLATHPIRLRWVAAYLARLGEYLVQAFEGELSTNPVNPGLFFDHLMGVSPQAQPPVVAIGEKLFVSVREQDWHERCAPLKDSRGERRDWLADLDDGAIDDVADTIARYLEAYPHKADGLHILYIVRRHGARGLHRLVKNVLGKLPSPGATLVLTLFCDVCEIRDVEEVLQDFDDPDHRAESDRPPVQATLHRWEDPESDLPTVDGLENLVDIAVIPNLFGASTRTQDGTRDGRLETGKFDPLFDEPTRLERVGSGDRPSPAVSRVLLPVGADRLLETWSTLTTRQFRGTPVGDANSDSDIDHVTIQVSLEKNRGFFDALHRCSHWVVTVDAFVGREQVEALQGGPEVVRVKTGVGANGAYRMVVSSIAGRRFIESRLERRIRQQVLESAVADPGVLAASVYDRARLLVPGIVLRSLGLGRTAAEMVGLVIARERVEQAFPATVGPHGFQSWLSLDEHPEWSGGHRKTRADLARFRGWLESGVLHVAIDVVEAKMRTQFPIKQADGQLSRSVELLSSALLVSDSGETAHVDVALWRRLISRAIEQTSAAVDSTTPAATHVVTKGERRSGLDEALAAALRQGALVIEDVQGVLVSLRDGDDGDDTTTPAGHRWLRMTLSEARDELQRLATTHDWPLLDREASSVATGARESGAIEAVPAVLPTSNVESGAGKPERDGAPADSPAVDSRGGASAVARRRLQELLDALNKRGVDASPADGADAALEGPGFYVLRIELKGDTTPQKIASMATDLQYLLRLEAGQVPRIYVDLGAIVVELPKRPDERYYVSAQDLWARTEWRRDVLYAPIGVDVRNRVVGIDFSSSRSPHLLVGGMTGGGKSVALEMLLMGLVEHYPSDMLELRIIDPKGNEFPLFEGLPHLPAPPGMDAEDAIAMLEETCEEMDQRYRAMKELSRERKERVKDLASYNKLVDATKRLKWIVVILDEFADLTADKDHKKTIEGLLQRVAQKARACGIHAIVATQKPSAQVISTTTRSNLGAQLALRVKSGTDSRVIMETAGAESLAGNGDAFLRLSGEEPIRIQCAKLG